MQVDPSAPMPDPHAIYQDWLDTASAAIMSGDVDTFTVQISLPFIMRTSTHESVLETVEDLRSDTLNVVQALRSQQVTHYIRLVKQARYLEEDVVEGWHTTYVLRNATAVTAPYSNRMVMRCIDGVWKVTEADHELSGHRFPLTLLRSAPGSFTDTWASAKGNISATQARAEPVYQAFIDSLSDAILSADFDAWCDHFSFPYSIHYDTTDHIANTPEDVRTYFDLSLIRLEDSGATRMVRTARHAEFLSDDRIFGYHNTVLARDDETVFGPIKSRMTLTFEADRWKCSSVTNSLSQGSLSELDLKLSSKLPTMREIQERMRK